MGMMSKTNEYSLYSSDRLKEIMFHVATMMPTDPKDEQQV
jgi:hypothetical protein